MWTNTIETPVGSLRAFASTAGLRTILWPEQTPGAELADAEPVRGADAPMLARLATQLREYFAGSRRAFDLSLDPVGTEFQQRVWAELRRIPFGETQTYSGHAAAIGRPSAARAVGAANGRNPLSIVVPCHRVVGVNGSLTGFAGGLPRKRFLLALESSNAPTLRPRPSP